jgi:hypothetical protein
MPKTYWLSSLKMTVGVDVDDNDRIIDGAPVIKTFIGQPLKNLIRWMSRQAGFHVQVLPELRK